MLRVLKTASREVDGVKKPFTYETFVPRAGEFRRAAGETNEQYGLRLDGLIGEIDEAAAEVECKTRTEYVNREADGTYVAVLQADKPTDTIELSGFEAALSNGLNLLFNAPAAAGIVPKKRGKEDLRREAVAKYVGEGGADAGAIVVQWMVAGTFASEADKLVAKYGLK